MNERVLLLLLTPQQPLRERRAVVRPVRVLRPDGDAVAPARLPVTLDNFCGGQPAANDPDHLASRSHIGVHECVRVRLLLVPYVSVDLVPVRTRLDDTC